MPSKRQFFRVIDAVETAGRWHLKAPVTSSNKSVDPWQFTAGQTLIDVPPLFIPVRHAGQPLNFTFAGFDIPVVDEKVQAAIETAAPHDVQFFAVTVVGTPPDTSFAVLNATRTVAGLDEEASEFTKWTAQDRRPDKTGQYRMVTRLVVDGSRVPFDVFRIAGWEAPLIVSDAVRQALEPFSGIQFQAV